MQQTLSGERVLWEGHPPTGFIWRPIEFVLIPFSLFWGGFAFFWNYQVWTSKAPTDFALFGIPFLIAGIYVTIGRFVLDSWIRSKTTYRLTNRRAIISRGSTSTRPLDVKHLPMLELVEHSNGSGTIKFESDVNIFGRGAGFAIWSPSLGGPMQFTNIPNPRAVYDLILKQTEKI